MLQFVKLMTLDISFKSLFVFKHHRRKFHSLPVWIPISDFLIPLVRPSRHYHLLSYRLITATTDYYNFSFFPRAVFHWNNLPLETVATLEQFNQAVSENHHTFTFKPNLYPHFSFTDIPAA